MKATVLGAGMVGTTIAWDLARMGYDVTVVDARQKALLAIKERVPVHVLERDLSLPAAVTEVVAGADIVVGALSSALGLQTLQAVVAAKKNYVDISFMEENAWEHGHLAEESGVTCVVDCGVAPGSSNVLIGHEVSQLDSLVSLSILVGGLPVIRKKPFEYKAPFAPIDVINEYVRPSRVVEHGQIVFKEALSEPELVEFSGVGTLEAFNTDGLRSLAYTMQAPTMREKTLRYPGHIELMRVLRDAGFFSAAPMFIDNAAVTPLDVSSRLLFKAWAFEDREPDLTVLRVVLCGTRERRPVRITWEMDDRYDPIENFRSMSRTTGFPAVIVANLMATGDFVKPGVHPPEAVGRVPGLADRMVKELGERGVRFRRTESSDQ